MAGLLQRDSVHGRYPGTVTVTDDGLDVDGDTLKVLSTRNPADLPWGDLGVDVVIESTGFFATRDAAAAHLDGGAPRVIVSAPAKGADATFVVGVNDDTFDPAKHTVVSNASCTTNCLAPVAKVLHETFGLVRGFMTTTHAYTNDQKVIDMPHSDLRRARAAAYSIIPTTTGAAKAVGEVLPELKGKLDGLAMRVPVIDGSVVDLVAEMAKPVTKEAVNAAIKAAAEGPLKGILQYTEDEIVSCDVIGNSHSSVFDAKSTMVMGDNFLKVISWYDNEWGYSNRCIDLFKLMAK
jgi:glyceraldehyde 3-phosphate dehydrogenase